MFAAPGFDAAWAEGRAMTLEQAIAYALAQLPQRRVRILVRNYFRCTAGSSGSRRLSTREARNRL